MKFYTIDQIAEMLQLHRTKVEKEVKTGRLKAINVGTAARPAYRISEEDLKNYIEERKTKGEES